MRGFPAPSSAESANDPEMASACTDGSMSSDEDELGIDSLERLVDERLAAITNK